ncbi:hypothetical protein EGM51_02765 [Verrucomicrobia bacterium S94]|nr:hypothetical protein EGM51_02765 [Verrucomicrobia bacterium S94]
MNQVGIDEVRRLRHALRTPSLQEIYLNDSAAPQPLIMNWFKARKTCSPDDTESLNRKVNPITGKAFGFRSYKVVETALFHTMGELPEL